MCYFLRWRGVGGFSEYNVFELCRCFDLVGRVKSVTGRGLDVCVGTFLQKPEFKWVHYPSSFKLCAYWLFDIFRLIE